MKRVVSILTVAALLLSLTVSAFAVETVSLPWYAEAQNYVTEKGIMTATNGDFQPDGPVTRAVVFQTLYRMAGAPATPAASFTDTPGTWYADAAGWAEYTGLAAVSADKLFHGDRLITRGELATIFFRYAQQVALLSTPEDGPDITSAPDHSDVGSWAAEGMKWCLATDVLSGKPGGLLDPNGTAVQAELAQMLFKLSKVPPRYSDTKTIRILATSDLHGWFVPWDFAMDQASTSGGLTLLSTVISANRESYPELILVDAGDTVQANYSEYFIDAEQNPMLTAMNYLKYDIWTWGNHEYNFTSERRQNLIDQFNGVCLSGNVYNKNTNQRYLPATTVVERDGVKIGFIGITTPMIANFEAGRGTLDDMDVRNPLDETALALQELQEQDVDAIIGIYHMGINKENEVSGTSVTEIAERYPELDVIIAGHSHSRIDSQEVNGVLITEPKAYAQVLSVVDLVMVPDENGYHVEQKRSGIQMAGSQEDAVLAEIMAPYKTELQEYVNTPIGQLINSDLSAKDKITGISSVFTESTGILSLLETAGRYYSGADVVALNTDYENAGFPVGPISIKNISQSYSYSGGEVTVYKLTGAELKIWLEWCGGYYNQIQPGDLTISYDPVRRAGGISEADTANGVTYWLDLTKPVGSRVQDLCLITEYDDVGLPVLDSNGNPKTVPVTDDMEILFGCNSYDMDKLLADGGMLEGHNPEVVFNTVSEWGDDGTVRALTIRYIKEALKGTVDGDAFNYDNWYLYTGIDETSPAYLKAVELINNGTLTLPALENGRTNVRSITEADVAPYL